MATDDGVGAGNDDDGEDDDDDERDGERAWPGGMRGAYSVPRYSPALSTPCQNCRCPKPSEGMYTLSPLASRPPGGAGPGSPGRGVGGGRQ